MLTGKFEVIERVQGQEWVLVHTREPGDFRFISIHGRKELEEIWQRMHELQPRIARLNVNGDTRHLDIKEATA